MLSRCALCTALLCLGVASATHAQPLAAPDSRLSASLDSDDWLAAGVAAAATAGSFLVEENVRSVFQQNRSGVADVLERVGWWYGTPLFTVPASLLTLGAGALFDDDELKDTGILMSELLLTVLFVQQPLRIVVGRARPLAGEGHVSFHPFNVHNEYASFLSGHSWSAFGISNIVARQIDKGWASVGLYSLATITAFSRMYADRHWLTDVVLGSVAGYAISTALWDRHEEENNPAGIQTLQAPSHRWITISLPL